MPTSVRPSSQISASPTAFVLKSQLCDQMHRCMSQYGYGRPTVSHTHVIDLKMYSSDG